MKFLIKNFDKMSKRMIAISFSTGKTTEVNLSIKKQAKELRKQLREEKKEKDRVVFIRKAIKNWDKNKSKTYQMYRNKRYAKELSLDCDYPDDSFLYDSDDREYEEEEEEDDDDPYELYQNFINVSSGCPYEDAFIRRYGFPSSCFY